MCQMRRTDPGTGEGRVGGSSDRSGPAKRHALPCVDPCMGTLIQSGRSHSSLWGPRGIGLAALLTTFSTFGCARQAPRDPSTEVRMCVDPAASGSSGITPQVRTDGAWIGASASQVIHLRGKPDERRGSLWLYQASPSPGTMEVLRFSGARVVSVSVLPGADAAPLCASDSGMS